MLQNDLFESENTKTRVGDACEAAGGGTVADLVEMVERMAMERRSVNQILAAVREFAARKATDVAPNTIWLSSDSAEGRAWARYWRRTKGKTPPQDKRGGWFFPSQWPPGAFNE